MAWDGNGSFSRTNGDKTGATAWQQDQAADIKIRADRHDTHDQDLASGINNCITKDGQNTPSSDLPMGGRKHTNVSNAAARNQYASLGQLQDRTTNYGGTAGGTANAITISLTPSPGAYVAGQVFNFLANADNTGNVTLNVSGIGVKAVKKANGVQLSAGDLKVGQPVSVIYNGTDFLLIAQPDSNWIDFGHTPTYSTTTAFTVPGDETSKYTVGRRIRIQDSAVLYGVITASAYSSVTTVTVSLDSGDLSASITAISVSVLTPDNPSLPNSDAARSSMGLGTAAKQNVGTSENNVVQLAAGGKLPAVDGSALTNLPIPSTNAMRADLALIRSLGATDSFQLVGDGWADAFNDETGINTGSSVGETHDNTNKLYTNQTSASLIAQGTGTNIGDMTTYGGLAAAFDGETSEINNNSAAKTSVTAAYVGKNYSGGKAIAKAEVWPTSNVGYAGSASSITFNLRGKATAPANSADGTLLGTLTISETSSGPATITSSVTTSFAYVWVEITVGSSDDLYFAEVQFYERGSVTDMTLQSATQTAPSNPASGRVTVVYEPLDSITLNTDLTFEMSCNAGTNKISGTLSEVGSYGGNKKILTATVDLSAHSGTDVIAYLKTANSKAVSVDAWAIEWSG